MNVSTPDGPSSESSRPYGVAHSQTPKGPLSADLTRSTAFVMEDAETLASLGSGEQCGEFYIRYGHPVGRSFESRMAALEGGDGAVAFSSGMAAFHAVFFTLLDPGTTLVCSRDVYGGIHALIKQDLVRFGVEARYFDPFSPGSLEKVLDETVRLVHVETPTNPLCRIIDIERIASIAHRTGARVSVDATFAPPPLQRPGKLGADIVVHSATKFIGGHSDALAGVVISRHEILEPLERFRRRTGGIISPDAAWLCLRSLPTLELRARTASETARQVAAHLETRRREGAAIEQVHYPGLPNHPDFELAQRQMDGFGALLSFEMHGGVDGATGVYDRLRRISRAPTLGGVESVSSLPLFASHAGLSREERAAAGISDGLVRISVGLERFEQLAEDLDQAIATNRPAATTPPE